MRDELPQELVFTNHADTLSSVVYIAILIRTQKKLACHQMFLLGTPRTSSFGVMCHKSCNFSCCGDVTGTGKKRKKKVSAADIKVTRIYTKRVLCRATYTSYQHILTPKIPIIGICENTPRISIIGSLGSIDPSARATGGCGLMQVRNFGAVNCKLE